MTPDWRSSSGADFRPARLRRSQLNVVDIAASTMANIAPAMSFYFGFGFLFLTAGVASPLTVIAAAVAMVFLGNTLAQFARAHPSTGSFITFIGKAFGPTTAIATAIVLVAGYVVGIVAVIAMSGGFTAIFLHRYFPTVDLAFWPLFVMGWVTLAALLMVRGIHISTRWAGTFFAFEISVLVAVSLFTLMQHRAHLTLHPFDPHYLASGLKGLGVGFPLAVYMFIGWENSATLAEETDEPRRNVPRAIFTSIAAMAAAYVLFSYATIEGFGERSDVLSHSAIAFVALSNGVLGGLAFFAYLAGLTSTVACVIAAVNSQSRLLFNAGREGLLPEWLGHVYRRRGTPVNALLTFVGLGLLILIALDRSQRVDPVAIFDEASTLGTMMILVVYLAANLALPFYYRRYRPAEFSTVKHLVLPLLGAAALTLPLYELFKPGVASPYDWFPYIALGIIGAATAYAVWLNAHDSSLAERVGSVVADEPIEGKFALSLDEEDDKPLSRCLRRSVDALAGSGELDAALHETLLQICRALEMDAAAVFVTGIDGYAHFLAGCGTAGSLQGCPALPLTDPVIGDAVEGRHVVEVADAWPLPEALLSVACRGFGSLIVAPAISDQGGTVLVLSRRATENLGREQVEFTASISQVIALAVTSRTLKDQVQRSAAVLHTAYAVARAITHSLDLEQTYHEIAVNAARVVPGSRCVLFEMERDSGELVAVAASDVEGNWLLHRRARLQAGERGSLAGELLPGSTLRDVRTRSDVRPPAAGKFAGNEHPERDTSGALVPDASLVVPLVVREELVGCLLVYASNHRHGYSAADISELQAVGEQAAISIHNALLFRDLAAARARVEALLTQLARTREEERRSLARIVHDDVVQSVVGAIYRLESLRDDLPAGQLTDFDEAVGVLRRSVAEARLLIWGLRSPALDGLSLRQALYSLAERVQAQSSAHIKVSAADIAELGEMAKTGLYKIAREALLNSIQHAQPRHIRLTLARVKTGGDKQARLRVEDDGRGFETSGHGGTDDHFGRELMAEQAALMGGTFSFDSRPGRGTWVEVVIPLVQEGGERV